MPISHFWCEGGDLNPHAIRHTHLKRACLPIPAPSHITGNIITSVAVGVNPFFAPK